MGQISLPVINRSGLSMHWESSGESNYNKSNLYVKDFYIRELISLIYKSYTPFFNLNRANTKLIPGIYLSDANMNSNNFFNRTLDDKFYIPITNESYKVKTIDYIDHCNDKFSELMEKTLPTYNGNTLILRDNDSIIIIIKYFLVIRANWHKQSKNYEHLIKTKTNSVKHNVYRKQLKRFRKLKSNQYVKETTNLEL